MKRSRGARQQIGVFHPNSTGSSLHKQPPPEPYGITQSAVSGIPREGKRLPFRFPPLTLPGQPPWPLALLLAGRGLQRAKDCQPLGGAGVRLLEPGGAADRFRVTVDDGLRTP